MVKSVVPPHSRGLHKHLVNVILVVPLVILICKAEGWVFPLLILKQAEQLLELRLALLSLTLQDCHDHVEDLLEADIGLIFLTDQGVDLVNRDLAFHICLDL
jgi:hypothetical protein